MEYYHKYRTLLQAVVDKSEDEFEKKIVYISAGALGLSFTFISNIVKLESSTNPWLLITGWIFLITCILINLFSHISSKKKANNSIKDIDDFISKKKTDDTPLREKIDKRNKCTNIINNTTIWIMIIGIVCILLFVAINII